MFHRFLPVAAVLFATSCFPLASLLADEDSAWPGEGPVASWTFDEDSFSQPTIVDSAGGDNNGALQGTPPAQRAEGVRGTGSLRFTAAGQQVSGSDAGFPAGAQPGSISLWFCRPEGVSDKVLFVHGTAALGQGRGLWLTTETKICFYFFNNPPDLYAEIPGGVTANRWHHIAGTYDGDTARVYYDGRQVGQIETRINTVSSGVYRMGANQPRDGRDFTGGIDDVAVFNRVLSPEEIREHYAAAKPAVERLEVVERRRAAERAERLAAELRQAGAVDLVFAVRQPGKDGHWYANFGYWSFDPDANLYGDGGRLVRLNVPTGQTTVLLDDPTGGVRDPQVYYDAEKILFSYRKGGTPYYHLWEINVDGSGLRQLTDGPYDDFEPTYTASGEIIFCSSRCNRWVPCWSTLVANLHRCDADGGNIRMISSNIEQENTPFPLPDGRILYTRWEYVDRSQVDYHHLWTINPDGTGQMVFYGNMHPGTVMIDAVPIAGSSQIVASFSPGHGRNEHQGAIYLVDGTAGPDAPSSAQRVSQGQDFRDPWPLSEEYFLAARGRSIVLMDRNGATTPLYTLSEADTAAGLLPHEPRPIVRRRRERLVPRRTNTDEPTGRLVLANVNNGRNMAGVRPGEIKKLLVLESLPKPVNFNMPGHPTFQISYMEPLTIGGSFCLARVLGTVPVEADGSAYFELPAMRSLFFVALDEDNLSVKRMQSFVTVQPGETTSCSGCHEQRTSAPPARESLAALNRGPSRITPFADTPDVLDFPRDIQPILDRHCVECHNPDRLEGDVDLCGDHTPVYSAAYWTIVKRRLISDARNGGGNRPPRSIGSSASRLLEYLDGSHHEALVTPEELTTIKLWIETGGVYPGAYASYLSGIAPVDFPLEMMSRRCGACHAAATNSHPRLPWEGRDIRPWARLPLKFGQADPALSLCNLTRPEKSRLLLAPLAESAGGHFVCRTDSGGGIFADTADPDYQTLLAVIAEAKRSLETMTRFDMPHFRPNEHYLREMRHFGILPAEHADDDPIDVYAIEQAFWRSKWSQAAGE